MVKKIKRYIVFYLFSLFFALLSGKIEKGNNKSTWNSAEAGKCCVSGTTRLCGGECCSKATCCGSACCDKCNEAGDSCY